MEETIRKGGPRDRSTYFEPVMSVNTRTARMPGGAREAAIDLAPAFAHIAEALETSLDRMVSGAVAAIWEQVPAYRDSRDERLRRDVAAHVEAVGRAFLTSLTDRRPARRADFGPTPAQARRRVEQGISLADFLQAFRIGQFTLWQGVLEAVLLEDLLARRDPSAGPRQATLRGVGLQPDTSLLVVSAAAVTPLENDHGLREAAATLRRSRNRGAPGLAACGRTRSSPSSRSRAVAPARS